MCIVSLIAYTCIVRSYVEHDAFAGLHKDHRSALLKCNFTRESLASPLNPDGYIAYEDDDLTIALSANFGSPRLELRYAF